MKLSGSRRNGRHIQKNNGEKTGSADFNGTRGGQHLKKRAERPKMGRKPRKALKFLTVFSLVLVAVISVVFAYYKLAVDKAPPVNSEKRNNWNWPQGSGGNSEGEGSGSTPDPTAPLVDDPTPAGRKPLQFTFLVLATDEDDYNTDTIMAVNFDASNYKIEVVNIPRDTLVNVSWNTKKINSIYLNMQYYYRNEENSKEKALGATVEHFANVLGFEVDYYFVVNLDAFKALVNAVDGIDYTIPVNMDYDDPAQNLHIHYQKGKSYHLNGQQAMEVVRFRKNNNGTGYASGDIGRINTQQDFLKTAAHQILAKKNSISITELISIFQKYISTSQTNLKINHLLYFAQELMKMDAENISFSTLPANTNDSIRGDSYVTIYVDEWLEALNAKLNPFLEPITLNDVSIYTRGSGGKLYVTDGNYQGNSSWGTSSSSGNSGTSGSSGNNDTSGSGGTAPNGDDNPPGGGSTPPGNSEPSAPTDTPDVRDPDTGEPDVRDPDDTTPPESENPPEDEEYPSFLGPPPEDNSSPVESVPDTTE